jgi:hypothetical protein
MPSNHQSIVVPFPYSPTFAFAIRVSNRESLINASPIYPFSLDKFGLEQIYS